jgi:hypothetical protein
LSDPLDKIGDVPALHSDTEFVVRETSLKGGSLEAGLTADTQKMGTVKDYVVAFS